jgi:hypothetical protein
VAIQTFDGAGAHARGRHGDRPARLRRYVVLARFEGLASMRVSMDFDDDTESWFGEAAPDC